MRQLDADLRRFLARRIVRGTVALSLLIAIVAIAVPTVRGHPARPVTGFRPQIEIGTEPSGVPIYKYPSPPASATDTRLDVGRHLRSTLDAVAILLVFVGVVLGASFVGAEYHLGSLTSQLLYEPRRWRVHLAKAATVALACAALAVGLCVAIAGLMYAGSELHGIVAGLDASWWRHRGVQVARAAGACAAGAVMGYALTTVARRTSAAIVAFFVMYPFIAIVRPDVAVFGPLSRYAPLRALFSVAMDPRRSEGAFVFTRTSAGGVALTLAWIAGLTLLSGAVFARSEVR